MKRLAPLVLALCVGSLAGSASAQDPGVADYSGADPEAIEAEDITSALAVARGTRIEAATPPTIRLPIYFEFNSTELRPDAPDLLRKVAAALASDELRAFDFSIEGHTDAIGSESYNADLSRRRAAVVKAFLVSHGVPEDRLATIGRGESTPVAANDSEEGRKRNRRVELINLGSAGQ